MIFGNPPYSIGQSSANDNNGNLSYPRLDSRIEETYAQRSGMTSVKNLYDSYIRAVRWASDRIGDAGVIGFVTNAGFVESTSSDGLRKCLAEEFSDIHLFHLRGNQRTSGELSKREGGKIFGSGSRTPVAITLLVKNPNSARRGQIRFHDIGDYLSREEKLAIVAKFGSIKGIDRANLWQAITPDEHGDWLKQRNQSFDAFMPLGDKKSSRSSIFKNFSLGVASGRDSWAYNFGRDALSKNMKSMIDTYEKELIRFDQSYPRSDRKGRAEAVDKFIDTDATKISWTRALKGDLVKGKSFTFDASHIAKSLYRPYTPQLLYYGRSFNEMVYQMPRLFPDAVARNRAIMIKGNWRGDGQIALMTNHIACLQPDGGAQCFPRHVYDGTEVVSQDGQGDFLSETNETSDVKRRDAITDESLAYFQSHYPKEVVTKDDLFNYIYGVLHSTEYLTIFADNLAKELPRIPSVRKFEDFRAFVEAGKKLGDMHSDFDAVEPYPVTLKEGDLSLAVIDDPEAFYRVEKMKFGGKRPNLDKTTVIYNPRITMTNIPLEAYDYVVNGKPALEWVMERQVVKTDKDSGIVNDANRYAIETVGDPAYPLKLFQRVITVSLETMKIVRSLPPLDIRTDTPSKSDPATTH